MVIERDAFFSIYKKLFWCIFIDQFMLSKYKVMCKAKKPNWFLVNRLHHFKIQNKTGANFQWNFHKIHVISRYSVISALILTIENKEELVKNKNAPSCASLFQDQNDENQVSAFLPNTVSAMYIQIPSEIHTYKIMI